MCLCNLFVLGHHFSPVHLVCSVLDGSRLVPIGAFGTISMIGTVGTWYNWCAASGLGLDLCHCYQLVHLVPLV